MTPLTSGSVMYPAKGATLKIANARFAVTMNQDREMIRDASILISGNRIVAIGKARTLELVTADHVIDATDMVVLPGLCNGHIHLSYAHAVRGLFPDHLSRTDYVAAVFRLQSEMTADDEYHTTLLALTELLKYGTTSVLDPGSIRHLDAGIEAFKTAGARGIVGSHVIDRETPLALPVLGTDAAIRRIEDSFTKYDGNCDGRVRVWAMPFSARLASRALLVAAKEIADEHNAGVTLHQNLRESAIVDFVAANGARPVQALRDWGVLGPNVLLAHLTGIDQSEVMAMAGTQTRGVVCPGAAMKLGESFGWTCPLPEMQSAGVTVGLGTDAANNANLIDTFRAMYLVAVAFKDARRDTAQIPAETALEMATCDGARSLGLDGDVGSIEVGKKADLILCDSRRPEWRALIDPVNNLVYSADGRSVHTVIVDGIPVVANHTALFVDEVELAERVEVLGTRLRERVGVTYERKWPVS